MLAEEGYDVVGQAGDGEQAVRLVEELRPDLVVLDVKMPKLDGITAASRIAEQRIAPVVILTAFSQRELVDRAREAGAMAYVVKPFGKADLVPRSRSPARRFAELQQLEAEVAELTDRLETRKLVDRAKAVLQQQLGLSEPDAFRWIQKTAMDLRLSMREVSQGVVNHSLDLAGLTSRLVIGAGSTTTLGEQWGDDQRRQQVADRDLLDLQQPQRDADEQQPAGRGDRHQVGLRQQSAQQAAHERQRALDDATTSADAATPQPNDDANAIEANPSSVAFRSAGPRRCRVRRTATPGR